MMGWFKRLFNKPEFKGDCVPRALYQGAAWTYQKKLLVRFIVLNISKGVDHIQCQVFYDGEWKWSTQWKGYVSIGDQEHKGTVIKTLTFKQLLEERIETL